MTYSINHCIKHSVSTISLQKNTHKKNYLKNFISNLSNVSKFSVKIPLFASLVQGLHQNRCPIPPLLYNTGCNFFTTVTTTHTTSSAAHIVTMFFTRENNFSYIFNGMATVVTSSQLLRFWVVGWAFTWKAKSIKEIFLMYQL